MKAIKSSIAERLNVGLIILGLSVIITSFLSSCSSTQETSYAYMDDIYGTYQKPFKQKYSNNSKAAQYITSENQGEVADQDASVILPYHVVSAPTINPTNNTFSNVSMGIGLGFGSTFGYGAGFGRYGSGCGCGSSFGYYPYYYAPLYFPYGCPSYTYFNWGYFPGGYNPYDGLSKTSAVYLPRPNNYSYTQANYLIPKSYQGTVVKAEGATSNKRKRGASKSRYQTNGQNYGNSKSNINSGSRNNSNRSNSSGNSYQSTPSRSSSPSRSSGGSGSYSGKRPH